MFLCRYNTTQHKMMLDLTFSDVGLTYWGQPTTQRKLGTHSLHGLEICEYWGVSVMVNISNILGTLLNINTSNNPGVDTVQDCTDLHVQECHVPSSLSEVSPVLPLEQFQCWFNWSWPFQSFSLHTLRHTHNWTEWSLYTAQNVIIPPPPQIPLPHSHASSPSNSLIHTLGHTHTHTQPHTLSGTHTHTLSGTHILRHTHTHTLRHTHTHKPHTHSQAHTHTHTQPNRLQKPALLLWGIYTAQDMSSPPTPTPQHTHTNSLHTLSWLNWLKKCALP